MIKEKADSIDLIIDSIDDARDASSRFASDASDSAERAEDAAVRAENATANLDEAITSAEEATALANAAANTASEATASYASLQNSITILRNNLNDSYIPSITSAIATANETNITASELINEGRSVIDEAKQQKDDMVSYNSEWIERRSVIDTKIVNLEDTIEDAERAINSIDNITVTSESIITGVSDATISDDGDHKNIHFRLRKGDPGSSYIIKGNVYASLSDLQTNVTDPIEGDLYNVGSQPPYDVYRWTGTVWENQGKVGVSVHKLTEDDIDDIFDNKSIEDSDNKYMGTSSVTYYTNQKILPLINGKVDAIDGKTLSSNDFTDVYKDKIDGNKTAITVLSNNKVDKISGKGLSSNDFTSTYKNQIDTNRTNISSLSSTKLNANFAGYTEFGIGLFSNSVFMINNGNNPYKISAEKLLSELISLGSILTSNAVASVSETKSYLGIE